MKISPRFIHKIYSPGKKEQIFQKNPPVAALDHKLLKQLSDLPMIEFHSDDLQPKVSFALLQKLIPGLTLIHLDHQSCPRSLFPKMLEEIKVPFTLRTSALEPITEKYFNELVDSVKSSKLIREVVIDHDDVQGVDDKPIKWPLDWLRTLSKLVKITEIKVTCLEITSSNLEEFIQIVSSIENCGIVINIEPLCKEDEYGDFISFYDEVYSYCLDDLRNFIQNGIKIIEISTNMLRIHYTENFGHVAAVFKKMSHLQKVAIEVGDNGFKMSLDEFALFQDLPVHEVNFGDLQFRPSTVHKFREVMMKMKIKSFFSRKHEVIYHGPGNIYESI